MTQNSIDLAKQIVALLQDASEAQRHAALNIAHELLREHGDESSAEVSRAATPWRDAGAQPRG